MTETAQIIEAFDARVERRNERRDLFKAVLGAAAVGTGFAFATAAQAQTVGDNDILNFALNLEYLEAQFYSYAANGTGLLSTQVTGTGTQGAVVTTGTAPPRAVNFTGEPVIAQYAREIAADEIAHVNFLRAALGSTTAVAQPAINISGGFNADGTPGAFSAAARAAGIATTTGLLGAPQSATGTFDPYSSPDAFLLGSFIFEDVGVTAYKGASPLLSSAVFLDAAAGILAVEAYHAAIVRTALYSRGVAAPSLRTAADAISDIRDVVDGAPAIDLNRGIGPDDDQGISPVTISGGTGSNIAPLNANGLAYSRSAAQTLNVVYLSRSSVTGGGFFPNGVNGTIRASAAN